MAEPANFFGTTAAASGIARTGRLGFSGKGCMRGRRARHGTSTEGRKVGGHDLGDLVVERCCGDRKARNARAQLRRPQYLDRVAEG